jgi:probable HAF family extracellular repeat protein
MMIVHEAHSGGGTSGGPEYEVTAIIAGFQCGDHLAAVTPFALNEAGDVAGFVTCSLVQRAFRWTAETGLELIPMPPQTSQSRALAISGSKVVGWHVVSGDEFGNLGFLYDFETDEFTSLGTLPGGNWSEAHGINSLGQITGFWGNNLTGPWQAFIWEKDEMIDLGPSIGGADNRAFDINDNGAITGWWREDGGERTAFLWESGQAISLGPIPGGFSSEGAGINIHNQVSGWGILSDPDGGGTLTHAFFWDKEGMIDLGTLPGFPRGAATDISNTGTIVGGAWGAGSAALIWRDGVPTDLNDLLSPSFDGVANMAWGINHAGTIVAKAHSDDLNATVGLLLSPINQGIPGDLDNDGQVGVKDLLILLGSWGPCDNCQNCPADLNNDCVVGVSDLLILLGNWG